MLSFKSFAGLAGALIFFTAPAFASSYYAWDSYGSCNEYGSNGAYIRTVNRTYCETTVGFFYNWDSYGSCNEYGSNGAYVRTVSRTYCETTVGYYYAWDDYGNCNEYGSNGAYVRTVNRAYCRLALFERDAG